MNFTDPSGLVLADAKLLGGRLANAADNVLTGGYGQRASQAVNSGKFGEAPLYTGAGMAFGVMDALTLGQGTVAAGVAKGANQALSVEGKALLTSNPVGSALKADPAHRAATFMREEAAANGKNFAITGGDGVTRTLTQVPGGFNGAVGRYEYIVDSLNNLTHPMFARGGSINGIPVSHE